LLACRHDADAGADPPTQRGSAIHNTAIVNAAVRWAVPPALAPPTADAGIDHLTFPRLRAFVAVAEEQSFTRAAARLHVAQQALSTTVRRLERELGARLFERTTRAVRLTPAGDAMLDSARRALGELARGIGEARRLERRGRGALCVGVMAGAALELTDPILAAFAKALPDVELALDPHLYDDPSAGLRAGTSDVALLRPPLDARGLELRRLFAEPRVAALSSRHPLARRAELSLADLHGTTVVRPASPDPVWNEFWTAGCPQTIDARTLEAALELLGARRAVAISAAGWARFYPRPGVRSLPVAGLSPSEVALAWRRGESNPLVRRFVDLAIATARAHPSLLRAIERPVLGPPAALARRRPA
jgi:DNA-binding transcriptional LysR family regulator